MLDITKPLIAVFGPNDTGAVVPARTIAGPLTQLHGGITAVATDSGGNLYVLDGLVVFEFAPTANGNVAPMRFVSSTGMYPYFFNNSLAVDSAGTIYVSAGIANYTPYSSVPAVFEFSASDSGFVAPTKVITLQEWGDAPESRIAVH